jgi:hypothetical protein
MRNPINDVIGDALRFNTYINKNGDEIRNPFYPDANRNNNQLRWCSINNGQGRNNMVVADFGNRLYLRRIIKITPKPYSSFSVVQLDDIMSVPADAVSQLY